MQNDGNLVLYDHHHTALWSTNTYGKTAAPSAPAPAPYYPPAPSPYYPPAPAPAPYYPPNPAPYYPPAPAPAPYYPPAPAPAPYYPPAPAPAPYVPPVPTYRDKLHQGYNGTLQQNEFLKSPTKEYYARLQDDGNFVIYKTSDFRSHNAIWASNTHGKGHKPYRLTCQEDGNLVLYDHHNKPLWASDTWN